MLKFRLENINEAENTIVVVVLVVVGIIVLAIMVVL